MEPSSLELYTASELIDELMRRKLFLGVVVHCREELKQPHWEEQTFKVHFNSNLDVQEAGRLLDAVAQYIDRNFQSDAH